jgi:hypothetical protein
MEQPSQEFLKRYSDDYANKWFEYHFDPFDIPDLSKSQQVATSIIEAIKPFALTLNPYRPS